jgi:hypothetical protein
LDRDLRTAGPDLPGHEGVMNPMHTAEVRIAADDDFGARLKDMRFWLDEHRFEFSTFTYLDLDPGIRIQVSFNVADEAQAFAQRFGGFLKYRTAD